MTKKIFVTIGVIVVVAIGVLVWTNKTDKQQETVRIGAVLPLTGDMASYSAPLKRGMDLAVKEINCKGGINNAQLQVIYEDDRGEAKTAISAYRKLVDTDKVPMVIGGMFSVSTFAIAPLAEKEHKVLLSPTASAIELTTAGDYIFRIYPSDIYDGIFLAQFAYNELQAKKVAVIYEQVASVVAIANKFKSDFESFDGEIVTFDGYNSDVKDFSSVIKKVSNANPDIVFIPGNLNPMANLLIQTKQLGLKKQFLTISTIYDNKIFELAKEAAEGVLFSSPMFDPTSNISEMTNFVTLYKKQYNAEPDILGGYGYDVVKIAATALQNGIKPEQIKKSLYQIKDYHGVTGNTTFDNNGDVSKELKIMKVENGAFVPYAK
jgi:branched-chain amino acid transport system substrate-binding protein